MLIFLIIYISGKYLMIINQIHKLLSIITFIDCIFKCTSIHCMQKTKRTVSSKLQLICLITIKINHQLEGLLEESMQLVLANSRLWSKSSKDIEINLDIFAQDRLSAHIGS